MKILTEASGSITAGYLLRSIQELGYKAIASDIDKDCFANYLADDFIQMPKISEKCSWEKTLQLVSKNNIDIVIPSLDETLLLWAKNKNELLRSNIYVIISDPSTIEICEDKWKTYLFFKDHNIPTPNTSLDLKYSLIKPRKGRGSSGIFINKLNKKIDMVGNISQEIIEGTEYTVDVFCDLSGEPIYIVPRKRLQVKEGKSTGGIVIKHEIIESYTRKICKAIKFQGPINIQCFEENNGDIKFIEINPRIAGGMALGFAATENWIRLIVNHLVKGYPLRPVEIQYNVKMMRYYNEVFAFEGDKS